MPDQLFIIKLLQNIQPWNVKVIHCPQSAEGLTVSMATHRGKERSQQSCSGSEQKSQGKRKLFLRQNRHHPPKTRQTASATEQGIVRNL